VLGIGAVKTNWNKANGIKLEYVDPSKLIYSYTDDPNFEDIYYVGEVKSLTIPEIKKQFPNLTSEQLEKYKTKEVAIDHKLLDGKLTIETLYKFYFLNTKLTMIKFLK